MGRFDDDDATRIRPRNDTRPGAGEDPDATRVRPRGDFDETRIRPSSDGTRMLPPTDDEPRWEARAAVPPAGAVPPTEYYEEPEPLPDDRNWLRPLLLGVIGLVLLVVLLTGVWLIYTADDEPSAPQGGTSAVPSAPATTAATPPPATTAPPSTASAEPELVKVPDGLVGITEDEAKQRLADAGLRVQVTRREDATMAANTVLEVDPEPGSEVEPNSVVRIVVAVSPQPAASSSRSDDDNG